MRCLLVLVLLFLPTVTIADDLFPIRYSLPKVDTKVIEDVSYKCLDLEQWKNVLLLANDYNGLYNWRLEIKGALQAHAEILTAYELRITGFEEMLKIKDSYITMQTEHIDDLEKQRKRESIEERIQHYIMWAVILVETVTIGVLGVKGAAYQ